MRQLTNAQQAALALDKNISVTAGAGTGKTLILVERYISILLRGDVDIREVLAITFTNKAAAEMLGRVEKTLNDLIGQSKEDKNRRRLSYLRDHLSSAQVSTIHAFCARLLREFPLEAASLDPGFGQLSDQETNFLVEESIGEEISSLDPDDENWLALFRLFDTDRIRQMVTEGLNHRFEQEKIEHAFANHGAEGFYQRLTETFLEKIQQQFTPARLNTLQAKSKELLAALEIDGPPSPRRLMARSLLTDFCTGPDTLKPAYWQAFFSLATFFTTAKGGAYKTLQHLGGKKAWRENESILVPVYSLELEPVSQWLIENIGTVPAAVDLTILKNLQTLNRLIRQVRERYQEKKQRQRVVDYEDLQIMILNLFENNEEIRQRVARRFRYIMVDEFQDTNQLQYEIISRLTANRPDSLFIVGDPKQSIYGFRAADVRVFNRVRDSFRSGAAGSDLFLSESFRFKKSVNDFINFAFKKIMHPSPANPWEVAYEEIKTKREDVSGGKVELALLEKGSDENIQAVFIAARIGQLLKAENRRPGDIAVLLRSRTHLSEVEYQLRESEIPFRTIGGIGFYQGQEIYDMYHLIRFLINPADDAALIGILRSPFADLSDEALFLLAGIEPEKPYWERIRNSENLTGLSPDDREALERFIKQASDWIKRRSRIGYYDLLSELLQENLYRPVVATDLRNEQILANIDKMMSFILAYQHGYFPSIIDLADALQRLINTYQREGEAVLDYSEENTVKIMTIHQAKGLEFPLVFLPFLDQQVKSSPPFTVYFDEEYGAIARITDRMDERSTSAPASNYLYDLVKYRRGQRELAELKRLFYVGCTRARDQLILSGRLKNGEWASDTPLDWLLGALEKTPAELDEGWYEFDKTTGVVIHKSFKIPEKSGQFSYRDTIAALDDLEKTGDGTIAGTCPEVFTETPARPSKEIFSATQLMTFNDNRTNYYQRYHLGYFKDDYEKLGLGSFEDSDALLRGTLVHRMMERFPDTKIDDLFVELDISDDQLIGKLRSELTLLRDKIDRSVAIAPVLNARAYKNEVSILRAFGDDFLTGTLDRIYQDENNQWVIVDYKSNKIEKSDVARESARYKIQMEIYALLLASLYPSQKTYKVTMYFIYPDELAVQTYKANQIQLFEERYLGVINEIKQYYPYTAKLIS